MYVLLYTSFRLHFCMLKGWLKYGLNTDLINEKSLNVKMTNVGGNSPVFQLFGKNYFSFLPITGLKLRVRNKNLIFLFLNQNICCGYSKEPSQ